MMKSIGINWLTRTQNALLNMDLQPNQYEYWHEYFLINNRIWDVFFVVFFIGEGLLASQNPWHTKQNSYSLRMSQWSQVLDYCTV